MTLEDAINHCRKVASVETLGNCNAFENNFIMHCTDDSACRECATYHKQLADWLIELQVLRDSTDCHTNLIYELTEKLNEAKKLLKLAVEDFDSVVPYLSEPYTRCCERWRYAKEAEKLINGEDIDE